MFSIELKMFYQTSVSKLSAFIFVGEEAIRVEVILYYQMQCF